MKASIVLIAVLVVACAGPTLPSPTASPTLRPSATPTAQPTIDPAVGWRLVAAVDRGPQFAYSVRAATSAVEWSTLWNELSPGLDEPEIDFETDIAVVFAEGTGGPGNCSERRLDRVVIDGERGLVYSEISDPLAPRGCDAMLGGSSVFVVALARAILPASPFTLQLHATETCVGCGTESITVDTG